MYLDYSVSYVLGLYHDWAQPNMRFKLSAR
jgi:hypothetical protein